MSVDAYLVLDIKTWNWSLAGCYNLASTPELNADLMFGARLPYLLAAVLLLSISYTLWVALVFPLGVLLLSTDLLVYGIGSTPEPER